MSGDFQNQLAARLIDQFQTLGSQKNNIEKTLQDITDFILPNRGDFTVRRATGDRRNKLLFDTTAIQANELLAAIIHSNMTDPNSKWARLKIVDLPQEFEDNDDINEWLEAVERRIFKALNSTNGNFNQQNHELLTDLVAYGTGIMFVEDDPEKGIRFSTRHLSEIFVVEDAAGVIDTVYRKFSYTVRQAEQKWGAEALSDDSRRMLEKEPHKSKEYLHIVMPRRDAERLIGQEFNARLVRFDYASIYLDIDDKRIMDVNGFHEMPYLVPRWQKLVGETYGRGAGWNALSDIRMINAMSDTVIRAAQKEVDPPILVADDGVILPVQTFPGLVKTVDH
jgi:hypothetical protein